MRFPGMCARSLRRQPRRRAWHARRAVTHLVDGPPLNRLYTWDGRRVPHEEIGGTFAEKGIGVRLAPTVDPEVPMSQPKREQLPFYLAAAVGGMAIAYFLDTSSGRRRRHTVRDRARSLGRHGLRRAGKLAHHATSDTYGLGQRLVHRLPGPAPD